MTTVSPVSANAFTPAWLNAFRTGQSLTTHHSTGRKQSSGTKHLDEPVSKKRITILLDYWWRQQNIKDPEHKSFSTLNNPNDEMQDQIKSELNRLESEKEIKILYAVESGSRAWGFASTDSDWDVRFIYVHKPEWYLSIDDKKDSLEEILPNDIDLGGWEIRKALKLFHKSNPPLMEWLHSPIVYLETGDFAKRLRELSADYFNPKNCLHHYLHMAEGNFREYLQTDLVRTKKYFYVLRPILACQWIEKKNSMPPVKFDTKFNEFINQEDLRTEIETLLKRKKTGEELDKEPKIKIINNYLDEKINYFQDLVKSFKSPTITGNSALNNLFRNTLKEAWYNSFS